MATALAAIAVLAAGLLGGLALARSFGGQPTAQENPGLGQHADSHVAGPAQVTAGHGASSSPAGPNPAAAAAGAGTAGTGPAGTGTPGTGTPGTGTPGTGTPGTGGASPGGSGPTTPASPGPTASKPPAAPAPPAGYHWYTVPAASGGSTAGFTVAVPDGWQASRQRLITYLTSPSGDMRAEINLTPFLRANPVREARLQRREAIRQGQYPGYAGIIVPGTFHGAADAIWRFGWRQDGGRTAVADLLVSLASSAGQQAYSISMSAPKPAYPAAAGVFQELLQTFQPAP